MSGSSSGRVPAAILMSGTGSNARKLLGQPDPRFEVRLILTDNPQSNAERIASEFGVECVVLDIYRFCGVPHPGEGPAQGGGLGAAQGGGLGAAERRKLRDPERRRQFDRELQSILRRYGARLVALAGYDWVLSPLLCVSFLTVNVHPGDLRVRDAQGRRLYTGLGWVPTARAILNGETQGRSSTHLATARLDGGPIARVSRPVPIDLPPGVTAENILPEGASLNDVIRDVNSEGGRRFGGALIYTHSRKVQERLKEAGDWVEFPKTMQRIAELMLEDRLVLNGEGTARLDGQAVEDLFLHRA